MPTEPCTYSATGLILLAAGASSRFGSPKQLAKFQGQSLLRRAEQTALQSGCDPVVVVLGANADLLRPECDELPVTIVVNADWKEGMASSIRHGIAALDASTTDVVFLLVDQPLVTAAALRSLINLRRAQSTMAATALYPSGALGPPCVFDRQLFSELRALHGERGAKTLLARLPPDAIARLPLPEAAFDVDSLEDYDRITAGL